MKPGDSVFNLIGGVALAIREGSKRNEMNFARWAIRYHCTEQDVAEEWDRQMQTHSLTPCEAPNDE